MDIGEHGERGAVVIRIVTVDDKKGKDCACTNLIVAQ